MSLSLEDLDAAVARYRREVDRYLKLVQVVSTICRELVADNATPATVQGRVKDPERFGAKLRGRLDEFDSVEEVFETIKDLAGVRIVTYVESDRARVTEKIADRFQGKDGEAVLITEKDSKDNWYRATHCQVFLSDGDISPSYENLRGDSCEIQVCSLLAHVWNELEHDRVYKPTSGALSPAEVRSLETLGDLTRAGDGIIVGLLEATDARLADNDGEFEEQWDFVSRMRRLFPSASDFGAHSGQLYAELRKDDLNSPQAIKEDLFEQGDHEQRALELLRRFQEYLDGTNDEVVRNVNANSSDPLLMLYLEKYRGQVLNRHPLGRGKGRPMRVRSIASRYDEMCRGHSGSG